MQRNREHTCGYQKEEGSKIRGRELKGTSHYV